VLTCTSAPLCPQKKALGISGELQVDVPRFEVFGYYDLVWWTAADQQVLTAPKSTVGTTFYQFRTYGDVAGKPKTSREP
jgi:hypothetical protein